MTASADTGSHPTCKCGSTEFDEQGYCLECGSKQPGAVHAVSATQVEALSNQLACVSDPGRKHPLNQDAARVGVLASGAVYLGVADGVSSAQSSEVASRCAVDVVFEKLSLATPPDLLQALSAAVVQAHDSVKTIPYKAGTNLEEPEATVVVAVAEGPQLHVAWVGDSRAYAIGPDTVRQLTRDDSWLSDAVERGMPYEEALKAPHAHAILQCLGMRDEEPEVHTLATELAPEEDVLLCSDGLWNYFDDPKSLLALYREHQSGKTAVELASALVAAANAAGGRDNISVALLRRASEH